MEDKRVVGSVTYQEANSEYFEKRGLKRHARIWSLWALGVGAVISGQFSGWNFGIASAGWGGMLIAALIIAVMYLGLSFSLAELSPALPHTGGAYSFARSAMGPHHHRAAGLVPECIDRRDGEGQLRGAFSLATAPEPLLDGFRTLYGTNIAKLLLLFAVLGLVASFHTIIFAYGRQIYSLSRAGYYFPILSLTDAKRKTPHMALLAGTAIGLGALLVVWFSRGPTEGGAIIGGTLLNMAVFGAMISYAFQGLSFILLRIKMPDIPRPYRSPFGIPGAAITIAIALWTNYYQLQVPVYLKGVYAALGWYVAGLIYFAAFGRHRLVLSPEEQFAISKGHKEAASSAP